MRVSLRSAIRRRAQGYWRLHPADRRLVRQSALLIWVSALLIKFVRLHPLIQGLDRLLPAPNRAAADGDLLARAEHIAALFVAVANLHPMRTTCLPRAVALWWLLRRARIDAQIVLGVQPVRQHRASSIAAHAWVEVMGQGVGDPQQTHTAYSTILTTLPKRRKAAG